jgi:hypothetical protein
MALYLDDHVVDQITNFIDDAKTNIDGHELEVRIGEFRDRFNPGIDQKAFFRVLGTLKKQKGYKIEETVTYVTLYGQVR